MRIAVAGAGPSGLYFALLMKKADPSRDITALKRVRFVMKGGKVYKNVMPSFTRGPGTVPSGKQ